MKCGLMQILAVAMVLGHTVSMDNFNLKELRNELESVVETSEHVSDVTRGTASAVETDTHVAGVTRAVESAESSGEKSVDVLLVELDALVEELSNINLAEFPYTNQAEVYLMVDKLLGIRESAGKLTDKNKLIILNKVDKEIDNIVEKIEKVEQKAEIYIMQNYMYRERIDKELNIINTRSLHDVNIPWIREVCSMVGIEFSDTDKYLKPQKIRKKLIDVDKVLYNKIMYTDIILDKIYTLFNHIAIKKIQAVYDTPDKQSVRNVIGISAVCAIVTLCIVLLIAVRNRNQANTGVRLHNWA